MGSTTGATGNGPAAAPAAAGHSVRYEVTGSGQADVHYYTDGNMSSSSATEQLPWSTTVHVNDSYVPMSVMASNGIESSGPLECKIIVDGKVVTDNHPSGGRASSVNCEATVK